VIPSIDYLTCVLAGSILLAGASNLMEDDSTRAGIVLALIGVFLFTVGALRAFVSAMGI
jgi:hypothetical protein